MKVTEPSDEEKRLMEWWSERRVPEVRRRQTESADCNATMTEAQKTSAYLQYAMGELRNSLPTAGKKRLVELLQSFNNGTASSEVLGAAIKDLVDEHSVMVSLHHAPECMVRAPVIRKIVTGKSAKSSAAMTVAETMDDSDELFGGYDDLLTTNIQPVKLEDTAGVPKRKRTETLNGAEPRNEEDEDNAMCPVCSGNPLDDDRWVKCDGCSSWYHQICVLFNEMAHGKSVRFFCRTPGCRKRGSRQPTAGRGSLATLPHPRWIPASSATTSPSTWSLSLARIATSRSSSWQTSPRLGRSRAPEAANSRRPFSLRPSWRSSTP
jgi:hypothetical protein